MSGKEKREKRSRSRERKRTRYGRSSSSSSRSRSRSRERKRNEKEAEKEKSLDEKRKQKEQLKAMETPEEKRARRLAKKEAKERKKREKMGWDQEYMGYTNADNPFGDEHLLDSFVWHKKREHEVTTRNLTEKDVEREERRRQDEMRRELEKVKKRRLEREKEREAREEELSLLQRMKEAEMFKDWEGHEDTFHLEQAKLRSQLRIESGRAKPIDLLAKYVNTTEEDMDIEVQEPYHLLRGLNSLDLEDLLEDIHVYSELEKETHMEFWKDITTVCEDEVQKLRRLDQAKSGSRGAERRDGINAAVVTDISSILRGKTYGQLVALEEQVERKLRGGDTGTDIGYWESLLQQLKAHMARARLRDKHQAMLRKKLFQLKQEQAEAEGVVSTPLFPITAESVTPSAEGAPPPEQTTLPVASEEGKSPMAPGEEETPAVTREHSPQLDPSADQPGPSADQLDPSADQPGPSADQPGPSADQLDPSADQPGPSADQPGPSAGTAREEGTDVLIAEEDLLQQAYEDYEVGKYSPRLLKPSDTEVFGLPEDQIVDPDEDFSQRQNEKQRILSGAKVVSDFAKIQMTRNVGEDGRVEEEYNFNTEFALGDQNLIWKAKYKPRKPRFFNRVHTGFEWNKYNQTHYDTDSPPPKIVQGYKFNIFFPDLINKRQAPTYTITPCDDNKEFAILRFHAGPPYEDIAFKVVNREWDYSWKHGFKSHFNNNILQLWFRFKRNRYRR
ncbi:hypothetical protein EMCRGX_G022521 [Ephydatia muelleri]